MAVVKHDVCKGTSSAWYRPDQFPSEPLFIASDNGSEEDDGIVVFTVLDGKAKKSVVHIINATTMADVDEVPFPDDVWVPFPTHGEWYENSKVNTHRTAQ
jgi:carotenoid cleavage dioxygenase-like enzyme